MSEYLDRKYTDSGPKLFSDDPFKLAKVDRLDSVMCAPHAFHASLHIEHIFAEHVTKDSA